MLTATRFNYFVFMRIKATTYLSLRCCGRIYELAIVALTQGYAGLRSLLGGWGEGLVAVEIDVHGLEDQGFLVVAYSM